MTQLVKFEVNKENVAIITLSDPDRLNALSLDMLNQLHERIKEINDEKTGARCLIITGEGRGFCAGANLMDRSGINNFVNFNNFSVINLCISGKFYTNINKAKSVFRT